MEFFDQLRYHQALQRLRSLRQVNYFHDIAIVLKRFPGQNQVINDAKYVLTSNFPLSLSMKFFCQKLILNYEDIDKPILERASERHAEFKVETKLLFEFSYSSPIEKIMLIRHFRCYFELATQECFRLHWLIYNVKTLLTNNYPFSYDMQHFCRKLLWKYQECEEIPPLFVIVRGDSAEMKAKMLSQFKHVLPDDTLKIVMQFSNYKAYAKSHPFLRSMIMRNALISTTISDDVHFREFSMQILQEFKQYEMSLDANILMKELSQLNDDELVSDIVSNEYHLMAVSRCHFTTFRAMNYISKVFPCQTEFAKVLSLQLQREQWDQYTRNISFNIQ